ncbi:The GLUG motif-containing protein, partial [Anaerovirgula multivorans]
VIEARKTAALVREFTFNDWDFQDVWTMEAGRAYPYLKDMSIPAGIVISDAEAVPFDGSGTLLDPFKITSYEELYNIRFYLYANYVLENDIDLEGIEWNPLGVKDTPFSGSFDGGDNKIMNLVISKPTTNNTGLFGYVENTTIKNLKLETVHIQGKEHTGSLIGYMNGGTVENVRVEEPGQVTGTSNVGGLIGYAGLGGLVTNSSAGIEVNATGSNVGGLIGYSRITVTKSYVTGKITAQTYYVGGLIGYLSNSDVSYIVKENYATGDVEGSSYVGGLIGYVSGRVNIEDCYALGNVKATTTGSTTSNYVGGLIGRANGSSTLRNIITNCYTAGEIEAVGRNNGGLVGTISNYTTLKNSYYDGIKAQIVPIKVADVSRLTTAMKTLDNYEGWDFEEVWTIQEDESYPYLRKLPKPSAVEEGLPEEEVAGGKGTAEDPYILMTKDQLDNMRYEIAAHYRLGSDIDLDEEEWEPVGSSSMPFSGTLDGNGYSINNLVITKPTANNIGLFGYTQNTVIKNLKLENIHIQGGQHTGSLIGYMNGGTVENVRVEEPGQVTGTSNVGGLIGYANIGGLVTNSSTGIEVNATGNSVGGLIGYSRITVTQSYATGKTTAQTYYVGGLIGYLSSSDVSHIVKENYATGDIEGSSYVGGLVGYVSGRANIENCYALGNVKATMTHSNVGGLIGQTYCTTSSSNSITNCYAVGKIDSVGIRNGGLIGTISSRTILTNSYYDGIKAEIVPSKVADVSRLTSAMKTLNNYEEWNFEEIWTIQEGESYPYLRKLPKPSAVEEGLPEEEVAGGKGTAEDPYILMTKDQ